MYNIPHDVMRGHCFSFVFFSFSFPWKKLSLKVSREREKAKRDENVFGSISSDKNLKYYCFVLFECNEKYERRKKTRARRKLTENSKIWWHFFFVPFVSCTLTHSSLLIRFHASSGIRVSAQPARKWSGASERARESRTDNKSAYWKCHCFGNYNAIWCSFTREYG